MKLIRSLIISLTFLLVFIAAVLLNEKYPTVNTVWLAVGLAVVIWRSVYVFVNLFHDKNKPGEKRILVGLPNWYSRFMLDLDHDKKRDANDENSHTSK
jgi:hypothetical protein